jgi:hypothetical protein
MDVYELIAELAHLTDDELDQLQEAVEEEIEDRSEPITVGDEDEEDEEEDEDEG